MRIAGPATEETWVGDADGDPVMVLTAAPSQSLAAELARLLPDLRAVIGPHRRCTVVFDRGGYSPGVFTEIITAGGGRSRRVGRVVVGPVRRPATVRGLR